MAKKKAARKKKAKRSEESDHPEGSDPEITHWHWMPCNECHTPMFFDQWEWAGSYVGDPEEEPDESITDLYCPRCSHIQSRDLLRCDNWPADLRGILEYPEMAYMAGRINHDQFYYFAGGAERDQRRKEKAVKKKKQKTR